MVKNVFPDEFKQFFDDNREKTLLLFFMDRVMSFRVCSSGYSSAPVRIVGPYFPTVCRRENPVRGGTRLNRGDTKIGTDSEDKTGSFRTVVWRAFHFRGCRGAPDKGNVAARQLSVRYVSVVRRKRIRALFR